MVCPSCRHHLRYGASADAPSAPALTPLLIEGNIQHPPDAKPWEYTVVVSIRDDLGVEIAQADRRRRDHRQRATQLHVVGRSHSHQGKASREGRDAALV
jgi:hypothetical protein